IPRTTPEPPTAPVPRTTPVIPGRTSGAPTTPPVPPTTRPPGVVAPFPRPSIGASTYAGGAYGEMVTEPITGMVTARPADPIEMSGSLTGHLLARNQELYRRQERRRKLKTAMWVALGLTLFAASIAIVVNFLAGDFLRSLFSTFASWAG